MELVKTLSRNILSNVTVREAMRVQIMSLPAASSIRLGIRRLIKYKSNACLVRDEDGAPAGVVSKTDIVAAYYAGLSIESRLDTIMVSPPMFCGTADSLESALDVMRSQRVYRLYVRYESNNELAGVLAYPDIVGLLYEYCRACDRSVMNRRKSLQDNLESRITVKEFMTDSVLSFYDHDSLFNIMEGISEHRCGAVLIRDSNERPVSVISKTDLILAYARGIPPETAAAQILASSRVIACHDNTFLEDAVRKMILHDLQRLFVCSEADGQVTGVISLSDAARVRSGSCHACTSSRIKVQ